MNKKLKLNEIIDEKNFKIVEEIRECYYCLTKFKALKISDNKFCSIRCIKEKYGV